MKKNRFHKIKSFFRDGDPRSVKSKLNILYMLIIKGTSILLSLLLLPMTLDYVDSETYGVWLTISSMVAWISFFDIGLGNGLKNRLAEALATNDIELGKKYVSTTYAMLSLIFIPLMIILLLIVPYIDWSKVLNLSNGASMGLNKTILICVAYFCLRFILMTFGVVAQSFQKPAVSSMVGLIEQFSILLTIYLLTQLTEGSLTRLSVALCLPPLVILLFSNFFLFTGNYKLVSPSISYIDLGVVPNLLKLGGQFFIIQIAGIVQYQMINFLILRYFGAEEVTAYNVSYKYFGVLAMFWTILITPLWVAFTDAITKCDYEWIVNVLRKYTGLFILMSLIGVIMLLLSNIIYDLWIGDKVNVSFTISFFVLLYNIAAMFSNLYVTFMNGAGKLKVQTIVCCFSPILFLGICFGMIEAGFGIESILIAAILCNINGLILAPIQTYYIVKYLRLNRNISYF